MSEIAEVIDISWNIDDALKAGKTPESAYRKCSKKWTRDDEFNGLPQSIIGLLSTATCNLFMGERIERPEGVKLKSHYVWKYGRVELNDWFTDPDSAIADIERKLKKHGVCKVVPPAKVLKSKTVECRNRLLDYRCGDAIDEHFDREAKVEAVAAKAKKALKIPNVPKMLDRWAKGRPAESWEDEVESIVKAEIAKIADDISEWAEEAVEA